MIHLIQLGFPTSAFLTDWMNIRWAGKLRTVSATAGFPSASLQSWPRNIVQSLRCATLLWGGAPSVEARSLAKQIDEFFGPSGVVLDVGISPSGIPPHTAHFNSSSLATAGLLVKLLSSNAAEFPAISTAPGLTYRYDPDTQLFERSSASLGPVFVERAQTLGRGKFDLGVSYLFLDFKEWQGNDLDRLTFPLHNDSSDPRFGRHTATVHFNKFLLQSSVVSFFATYGITDRWDVNLLIPLIFTSWDARARVRLDNTTTEKAFSGRDNKTGVGDLLLRTKYCLFDAETFNVALGSSVRIPTGNAANFQGTGDTIADSFVAVSQESGRFHMHISTGMVFDFDDSDRSRIDYAGGVTIALIKQLALTLDVIGSSNLTTDRISTKAPQFNDDTFQISAGIPASPSGFTRVSQTLRTDIVDLAVGLKGNFGPTTGFIRHYAK
jgi:hypothetical protein